MGKASKDHRKKVQARNARMGLENPIARTAVSLASRGQVVSELRKAPVEGQIDALSRTAGVTNPNKLAKAITSKAPGEMDKGIRKLQKEGKPVTVDALCAEIKTTPGFLRMCGQVGLNLEWFEDLARKRMEALGL